MLGVTSTPNYDPIVSCDFFYSEHVTFSSFAYYINRKCSKFAKY